MRLATSAERTALLLELGTRTTDTGRVIHLDRDQGLWAEPYQPPARGHVTVALVRDVLLAAGLAEHQPIRLNSPGARRQGDCRAGVT